MRAIFIDGGPRVGWNTAKILEAAEEGAREAGAETEAVRLYDLTYTGCKSCFACKLKGSTTNGVCALRDDLRPVLERVMEADTLMIGSPIYFGSLTGETLSFWERLLFPILNYKRGTDGSLVRTLPKEKRTALAVTMNVLEEQLDAAGYRERFDGQGELMARLLGTNEVLYVCDTCQFDDYSKYDVTMFDPDHKAQRRTQALPHDLERAKELGRRLCTA